MSLRIAALALATVFAAATLAACGGSGDDEEEDKIREVVETATLSTDPDDCTRLSTQAMLEQTTFEQGEAAVEDCRKEAPKTVEDPDAVEVSNISVEGDTATADSTLTGGAYDGSTYVFGLVKEDGEWKLDEVLDLQDFDLEEYIDAFVEKAGSEGVPELTLDCARRAFEEAGEDRVIDALLSGNSEEQEELLAECIPGGTPPEPSDPAEPGSEPSV